MEGEIGNLILVWSMAILIGIYCYGAVSKSTKTAPLHRLLLLFPAVAAFTALPWTLSSFHLCAAAFFSLTWLANFKLFLLSFNTGPLVRQPATTSLPHFLCALLLPIKLITVGSAKSVPARFVSCSGAALFGSEVLCFGLLVVPYSYKEDLPEIVMVTLHIIHTTLFLKLSLAVASKFTQVGLGLHPKQLAPQFHEPLLSMSLQDFWGRRWNLIASGILKQTLHSPISSHCTMLLGKQPAKYIGFFVTFLVSGIMHEFMYYYITRVTTGWGIMRFFVFHGACLIVEVMLKKTVKWQLHRITSTVLTMGFLAIATFLLFLPSLLSNQVYEKAIVEYLVVAKYLQKLICI